MLLFICPECGTWQDVSLAAWLTGAWNRALAEMPGAQFPAQRYPCPQGHGLMVPVQPGDRLFVRPAEVAAGRTNEMNAAVPGPLNIGYTRLERVNQYTIKDCLDAFYGKRLAQVRYLLLSHEDYTALCREIWRTLLRYQRKEGEQDEAIWRAMLLYGVYITPAPDLSHEPEYAQVRLTLEYHEYRLPRLQGGEVMLLFV